MDLKLLTAFLSLVSSVFSIVSRVDPDRPIGATKYFHLRTKVISGPTDFNSLYRLPHLSYLNIRL